MHSSTGKEDGTYNAIIFQKRKNQLTGAWALLETGVSRMDVSDKFFQID